jgi:hypothetical protein
MWRVVCEQETSKTRRLKPTTGLWKIQPQWVVMPGKQTTNIKIFYILLTVHLDVILVDDQVDALFLNVFVLCLYLPVKRKMVSS